MHKHHFDLAIVGGGFAGLAALHYAHARGLRSLLLEGAPSPGGLGRCFRTAGDPVERYYHHFFSHDRAVLDLAREAGVADRIEWGTTRTGIYHRGMLVGLSNALDLLRLPFLSFPARLRFALFLWAASHQSGGDLDSIGADQWAVETAGVRVWREMIGPLVSAKFGIPPAETSAAFLRGRFSARVRSRGLVREALGTFRDGTCAFAEHLASVTRAAGVDIRLGTAVNAIERDRDGYRLVWEGGHASSLYVISTVPAPLLATIAHCFPSGLLDQLAGIRYRWIVCLTLGISRSLSPYYWINVTDAGFPFSVIVEHTRLVPPERYGGDHIVYIGAYADEGDPLVSEDLSVLRHRFVEAMRRIFTDFDPREVRWARLHRDPWASPVFTKGYGMRLRQIEQLMPFNFTAIGTHAVYPGSRNMNSAVSQGRAAATLAAQAVRSAC